jgi:4-amino-4-deoxy-L-arabinose transferase-like glycosyltransferase
MGSDRMRPWRPRISLLVLIALIAGVLRILVFELSPPITLVGDERYYLEVASRIAIGEGHYAEGFGSALRPPAQSFVLSLVANRTIAAAHLETEVVLKRYFYLEIFLGTLLVALSGLLGWALFDYKTGILTALIAAGYPSLIAFSTFLWSETLFAVLIVAALTCVVRVERTQSWLLVVAAGLAFGAAALTRELALPILGAAFLWWVLCAHREGWRKAVAQGVLMTAITVSIVAPWTFRNHRVFGETVPISTIGWFAAREGNTFSAGEWIAPDLALLAPFRRRYFSIPDEMERVAFARGETLDLIHAEQPFWMPKKLVRTLTLLLVPDSFIFKKVSRSAFGDIHLASFRFVLLATIASYLLVASTSLLGILGAEGSGRRLLPCLVLGSVFCVHLLANSSSRFRIPWMPLLIVYSSYAICRWRPLVDRISETRLAWVAVAVLGILVWSSLFFYPDAIHLWQHGTYVEPGRP